jgi:molecular chaperone GrpE
MTKGKPNKPDPLQTKIESLEKELSTAQENLKIAEEARLRALADLQNFQRRESEHKKQWSDLAVRDFLKAILSRFSELQLATKNTTDEDVKKVIDQFFFALKKSGLQPINPTSGAAIDPHQHEVLLSAQGAPGTVVQTLETGWQFRDHVLSPAKVSGAAHQD